MISTSSQAYEPDSEEMIVDDLARLCAINQILVK